jgi:hypothetical protein
VHKVLDAEAEEVIPLCMSLEADAWFAPISTEIADFATARIVRSKTVVFARLEEPAFPPIPLRSREYRHRLKSAACIR